MSGTYLSGGRRFERNAGGPATTLREPELLHHARLVPLFPALDDSAVREAVENESVDSHATPGRWDISEGGTVRSFRNPSCRYLVSRDDLIFDGDPQIREGGEQARHHLLESRNVEVGGWAAVDVNDAICRKHVVSDGHVPAVQ